MGTSAFESIVVGEALRLLKKHTRLTDEILAGFRQAWAWEVLQRAQAAQGQLRERCSVCGFRIRGPNHEAGIHHKVKHPSMRKGV